MKKLLSILLALCLGASCVPAVLAAEKVVHPLDTFGEQKVPASNISAFEGDYDGYVKSMDVFDGRSSHVLKRTGADATKNGFCYYRWGTLLDDIGEPIPLSGAKYIVVDYYYKSDDAEPALNGHQMTWTQVNICGDKDITSGVSFGVSVKSRNGMVANKWDQMVFPLGEASAEQRAKLTDDIYYLRQIKLYPLLGDANMGKTDVLYISDVSVQSWDPAVGNIILDRKANFLSGDEGSAPLTVVNTKDLDYYTIPEFTGTAPENMEFLTWKSTFDNKTYTPGKSVQMRAGQDVNYVPVYNYVFDFASLETAYINGYPDGTFLPQNNVTRAEACKIIASLVNPTGKDMGTTSFADVAADAWYYNAVTTLESLGALSIWNGNFEPNTYITRGEFVEIIYAIADKNYGSVRLSLITDITTKDRCFDAVMYAVSNGIVTGYEDGTFLSENNITRAETVTVINRLIGRVSNGEGASKFSDIEGHWAKGQIIASSSAKAEGAWTVDATEKKYVLEGTNAGEYIKALHTQAKGLTGDAVRDGVDVIAEQMKKDILGTKNTADIYGHLMSGNTYYISEKNGNDENNGKSPDKALKTLAALEKKLKFPKKGTAILFERGGVYRGTVNMLQSCIYGSYGEGEKPIVTSSPKNFADPALWKQTDAPNVYELVDKLANVGVMAFDHDFKDHGNYDALYGIPRYYGKHVSGYANLAKDLEFYPTDDTLYLYCEGGNPGERFKSIEIGPKVTTFHGSGVDVVVDNINVRFTGAHGINVNYAGNFTVTNCEFAWIGGSQMGAYNSGSGAYGNAVQLYGSCDGYYVKNNWMYQIYDTPVTHQGVDYTMNNIEYSGNLMEYTHWGIECWIAKSTKSPETNNYLAKDNVIRNCGYGWGTIVANRASSARLYSFTTLDAKNSNLKCENNILDRSAGYLIDIDSRSKEEFDANIYIQYENNRIGTLKGKSSDAKSNAAEFVFKNLKDGNLVFVLVTK